MNQPEPGYENNVFVNVGELCGGVNGRQNKEPECPTQRRNMGSAKSGNVRVQNNPVYEPCINVGMKITNLA